MRAPDRRRRLGLSWLALAVVLGVALAVGARHPGASAGPAQRIAAIEAAVRCPSCEDLSVQQSSAPTAVAIRRAVARRVAAGQSDADIEAYLVSRYGPGILLRPPAHGGTGVVWLLPVVAGAAALTAMGVFFWRRRSVVGVTTGTDEDADADRRLVEQAIVRGGAP